MIIDVNRIRFSTTPEILRWQERLGSENLIKIVESTVSSSDSPIIETAYLVKELVGSSPELLDFILKLETWYGIKEVRGLNESK
jgi:hypothetical protein